MEKDMKEKKTQPVYTLGEELISSISHGIGAGLGVAALVLCIIKGAQNGSAFDVTSAAIYGAALVILYTISCIYHALCPGKGKRVLRIIDHCSIFLLISGTYTPFTLVSLRGPIGWTLFGIVWGATILGVTLNAINVHRFRIFSMICYLMSGWVIIFAFIPLTKVMETAGIILLILGGVAYTIGAVLYGIGMKVKYIHSVFHFFVLLGSILHFFTVYFYVL